MLYAGIRRLALIAAALLSVTIVVSLVLGLAAGASAQRSISEGLYILGAVLLVGCFIFGVRGPIRGMSETGEAAPVVGARRIRTATRDERSEAAKVAILLFVLGLLVIVIGSTIDPTRGPF